MSLMADGAFVGPVSSGGIRFKLETRNKLELRTQSVVLSRTAADWLLRCSPADRRRVPNLAFVLVVMFVFERSARPSVDDRWTRNYSCCSRVGTVGGVAGAAVRRNFVQLQELSLCLH